MTIRNKGLRKIIIEHELYRWVIHPSASGVITLTVQHAEVKGRLLRVNIESDINELWMVFQPFAKQARTVNLTTNVS